MLFCKKTPFEVAIFLANVGRKSNHLFHTARRQEICQVKGKHLEKYAAHSGAYEIHRGPEGTERSKAMGCK